MNLARDASALSQHGAELRSHPTQAKSNYEPCQQRQDNQANRVEPVCLVEVWFQIKTERGAGFVPNPIVVTGDNAKRVSSRAQIRVVSDASSAAIDPVLVKAFQLVLEADLLRRHEARGSVIQVQARCARW